MQSKRFYIGLMWILAIFTVILFGPSTWAVTQEKVLHSFGNGVDGANIMAGLTFDGAGNLYGATMDGGAYGLGMVFELTPQAGGGWRERVLYSFKHDGTDGMYPSTLIMDATGNLYGTTWMGGTYYTCAGGSPSGCGTVFELTPQAGGGWVEKVLHSFGNGTDGAFPNTGLIFDAAGNLYGTTDWGGGPGTCGIVFELTPQAGGGWREQVLHSFNNDGADGLQPYTGVIFDAAGNLYGTTYYGGTYGYGTVFELTRSPHAAGGGWTEQVLHSFNNDGGDGATPLAGVIFDAAGNLYGTTKIGGTYGYPGGTVFEIIP